MISTSFLFLSGLFYSLQLNTNSFPKPLSEEEEKHYLQLVSQGDRQARNILVERNLRLVAHILKKYYAQTDDQEDLISIGTVGLIKSITSFNPHKGVRLATYAARCIENPTLSPRKQGPGGRTRFSSKIRPGPSWTGFQTACFCSKGSKTAF